MKASFVHDFNGTQVGFDMFNLKELKAVDRYLQELDKKDGISAMTDLVPFLTTAAQRVDETVTEERLESLLNFVNLQAVFTGLMAVSTGRSLPGEA